MAMRRESEAERQQRELADSLEYAARVARNPRMSVRVARARAEMEGGHIDEADRIPYEELTARHVAG